MKIPVVLSVVHVAIDADGVLAVDVDGVPHGSEQTRTRGDLRAVIDEITSDLGAPVRVEVREADGSTFTDVATPPAPAPAAAEQPPTPPPPALAGAGFSDRHGNEEVVVADERQKAGSQAQKSWSSGHVGGMRQMRKL